MTAGVGNYVTQDPPHLGNFVIAHTAVSRVGPAHNRGRLRLWLGVA